MGGKFLAETQEEKDLGIMVTRDLKQSTQASKAATTANSVLGRIKRTFTCLDEETVPLLYKALVRPRMEFAIQAWSPYLKKDIAKLEKVQRRATKLVPTIAHLTYEDRLKKLNMTTLEERRTRGDMIETYKILTGVDQVCTDRDFFVLDRGDETTRTRGHSLKLIKPRHRTYKRTMFFPSRVVNRWNQLPEDVITSTSVNVFKNRYDRLC